YQAPRRYRTVWLGESEVTHRVVLSIGNRTTASEPARPYRRGLSRFQGSAASVTGSKHRDRRLLVRSPLQSRCNPYRIDDGDNDGVSPRQSFPPVRAVSRPARLVLYILFRKERHHHGYPPHHRCTALPVRGRRLLLEAK